MGKSYKLLLSSTAFFSLLVLVLGFLLIPNSIWKRTYFNAFIDFKNEEHFDSLFQKISINKGTDPEKALELAQEAYHSGIEAGKMGERWVALSLYWKSWLKIRNSQFQQNSEEALFDAKMSLEKFRSLQDQEYSVKACDLIASCHAYLGRYDSTLHYLTEARMILEKVQNGTDSLILMAKINNTYGYVYERLNKIDLAIKHYYISYNIFKDRSDFEGLGKVCNNLCSVYNTISISDSAEKYITLALRYYELLNWNISKATTLMSKGKYLSHLYTENGNDSLFHSALNAYTQAIRLDSNNTCLDLYHIGLLYHSKAFIVYSSSEDKEVDQFSNIYWKAYLYYLEALESAKRENNKECLDRISSDLTKACKNFKICDEVIPLIVETADSINSTGKRELNKANQRLRLFEKMEIEKYNANKQRYIVTLSFITGLILLFIGTTLLQRQKFQFLKKQLLIRSQKLKAQMNPHFISNSLNAIESLVNLDHKQAASKYLVQFSRLCRMILTNSTSDTISLAEEIQGLEYYLSLEKLRMKDKLTYHIRISPDISVERTRIPPLLFQPFVENAIFHGIKNKQSAGHVLIDIYRENQADQKSELICIIEDNGVGREKAREIKENSILNTFNHHESLGISITEERIQMIGEMRDATLEIEDLTDELGQATGTRVIIKLPLEKLT